MNKHSRRRAVLGASLLLGALLPFASVDSAAAAPDISFFVDYPSEGVTSIQAVINGEVSGSGDWQQDPGAWTSGDTLTAHDSQADGYGIEAYLSTGRMATTRGHSAPYTDYATGDLPEDQMYKMKICVVRETFAYCSLAYTVYS